MTKRNSAKALSPQTDTTEAAESLGGKSRVGFIEKLVPVLWGERKNGLVKEVRGKKQEGDFERKRNGIQ